MGENQHGSPTRSCAARPAIGRQDNARALEDDDVRGGAAGRRLDRPLVVDGAINGELFLGYVRQTLAPTLRPGDVVVMDNLSSHKRTGGREAIEAVGAKLPYLPPYSPDFNPIEQAFSKF